MRLPSLVALTACIACGPSQTSGPKPSPVPPPSAAPVTTVASGPTLAGPPAAANGSFAASPLTDFATRIRELAFATLDGRPLPDASIPVEPSRDPSRRLRSKSPPPSSSELDAIAFAMEITLVLREPASAPSDDEEDGSIEVIAFLSRTGLKIAGLRTRGPRKPRPLPGWLAGVERFGGDVLLALQRRRVGELLVGEAERPVLNDDSLYQRLMEERPKLEAIQEAESLASRHPRVVGYKLDDVFLVTRDRRGVIWGLQLQLEDSDDQLMLDGSPLVRVERLEKEERDAPPPPPPPQ